MTTVNPFSEYHSSLAFPPLVAHSAVKLLLLRKTAFLQSDISLDQLGVILRKSKRALAMISSHERSRLFYFSEIKSRENIHLFIGRLAFK